MESLNYFKCVHMLYLVLDHYFSDISLTICCPFMPFLETVAEDNAELWVSSAIDPLHLVVVLIVVKGSQMEPEIAVF